MRAIFLLHSTGQCGGIKAVATLAARLWARGHDAQIWTHDPRDSFAWFSEPLQHRKFRNLDELGRELRKTPAKKIATWWETAYWAAENSAPGEGFYYVQDRETTYTTGEAQDKRCLATYHLGLTNLTTSNWVTNAIRELGANATQIGVGVDLDKFSPLPFVRERHRLFGPCRRQTRDLKGWLCLRDAALRVHQSIPSASLVTFGVEPHPADAPALPYIHLQKPSDFKLRELYSQAGVTVVPSQHEGFGLIQAEAMACGSPVVCTRAEGNEEFSLDNETCLLCPKGDGAAVAEACVRLMKDEALAKRLGEAGRKFVQSYHWQGCVDRLEIALRI